MEQFKKNMNGIFACLAYAFIITLFILMFMNQMIKYEINKQELKLNAFVISDNENYTNELSGDKRKVD